MSQQEKKPFRPTDARKHLLPAMWAWMLENDPVVYLVVMTSYAGMDDREVRPFAASLKSMSVPVIRPDGSTYALMRQDMLILNIGLEASPRTRWHDTHVDIQMRVRDKAVSMSIPIGAISAMYVPDQEKVGHLQFQCPLHEEDILTNGQLGFNESAANSPAAPLKSVVTPADNDPAVPAEPPPLDFSLQDTPAPKERPSFLKRVK